MEWGVKDGLKGGDTQPSPDHQFLGERDVFNRSQRATKIMSYKPTNVLNRRACTTKLVCEQLALMRSAKT